MAPNIAMTSSNGDDLYFSAQFTAGQTLPAVSIVLQRNGVTYPSTITLPPLIGFVGGTGGAATLTVSGAPLIVALNVASGSPVKLVTYGNCVRADQATFSVDPGNPLVLNASEGATTDGGTHWQETPADLLAWLSQVSRNGPNDTTVTSPVQSCQFTFEWRLTGAGTVDSGLSPQSTMTGYTAVTQPVTFANS